MNEWEHKGYDAFVAKLSVSNEVSFFHALDACNDARLVFGTPERRDFIQGWLKARDEL